MKKVILLKSNIAARGGLEGYTRHLGAAFAKSGHSVTLLTTGEVPALPFEVHSLCNTTKLSLLHHLRFDALTRKWLKENSSYDIIFGMERNCFQTHYRAGSGVHAAYLKKRALVEPTWKRFSFSLNPLHLNLLRLEKEAFEHPNLQKLFTNSHMVREEVLEHYRVDESRLCVVPNGVDWEGSEIEVRDPQKPLHFLFVGNGYKRKGLLYLFEGLANLKEMYTLTVVGKDKNLSYFKFMAEKLGLNVHFAGPQSNLSPFYAAADAVVIPSLYDPFANVTLEALARGIFVVTSKMNGGKEVLTEQSGVIIENLTDPTSVQSALLTAFAHPKTEKRACAIRESVRHLDFSHQLTAIVEQC
ncbi:MAG: glycosyltransferase family 4 protein [Chlamydiales bacterium]|nr:glycosyltransferase family 4 protein [Chlamydiales bacterium]